jgi:2-amino-4-hydroxy-6-hydroxymethyldihydropteridine diphosphokinase
LPVPQVTTTNDSSENLPLMPGIALIAVGSNLPHGSLDARSVVPAAIEAMAEAGAVIRARSDVFATPAFPRGSGPEFMNAAVVLDTPWAPDLLLEVLHRIEADFGRTRERRWAPRSLDLDLLAQGCAVLPDAESFRYWQDLSLTRQKVETPDQLVLPHPRLHERAFVLVPLVQALQRAQLRWQHPILGVQPQDLLARLPVADVEAIRPLT